MTKFYCGCVVLAMEALHSKSNATATSSPNILLDAEARQICDFASQEGWRERATRTCGRRSMSREMLANSSHGSRRTGVAWGS